MRRLAIFDVDGTLVDSQGHIQAAMATAFSETGLAAPDRAAVRSIIGLSLPVAVARLAGGPAPEIVERYKAAYVALAAEEGSAEAAPLFPGARAALDALAAEGVVLGIATGKSRRGLSVVLETHGLAGLFETVQVADDHPSKPHPSMIRAAVSESSADAAAMIGDTVFDMDMARAAGVPGLGVAWGYHDPKALEDAGASRVLRSCSELPRVLLAMWEPT